LQYQNEDAGWSMSALYNRVGQRIYLVGFQGYPDIYENGRNIIDLQVGKKILKGKGELRFNVGDLLNEGSIFYQNGDAKKRYTKGQDQVINSIRFGSNYSVSFTYQFQKGK
jgi:hypothetical protein